MLAEQGIIVPTGIVIQVHEATPTLLHLVLPTPQTDELTMEQLGTVVGGNQPVNIPPHGPGYPPGLGVKVVPVV